MLPLPLSSTTFCFPDFILKPTRLEPHIPAMPEINIFYPNFSGFLKKKKKIIMLKCGIENNEHKKERKIPQLLFDRILALKKVSLAIILKKK